MTGAPFESLSLEYVIQVGVIAAGWIVTIVKIDGRLKSVEAQIKDVIALTRWRERMEERMLTLRRDVERLRQGRGFIREEINGEYTAEGKTRSVGPDEN